MTNDMDAKNQSRITIRILPWWSDDCSTFLNNIFKWLPGALNAPLRTLEFGGGNSTLYLLSKGSNVVTVESDENYIEFIRGTAKSSGYKVAVVSPGKFSVQLLEEHHLTIIKASKYEEVPQLITQAKWDFIVSDGIARAEVLNDIRKNAVRSVVILDNVEYCANWGRLDRTSAKPDLIKLYRSMLRDSQWRHYIFEQMEGREGRSSPDKTGCEAAHRWASAVLWPTTHFFSELMLTHLGFPLVNMMGIQDADTNTLHERCPFDWTTRQWQKESFPPELDLKLPRDFG